jgi:hypothetical protein
MKIEHLQLSDGILEVQDGKIVISDNAKTKNRGEWVAIVSILVYGLCMIFTGIRGRTNVSLYLGLTMVVFCLPVIYLKIKKLREKQKIFDNTIYLSQVAFLKFDKKQAGLAHSVKIKTTGNNYREIFCTKEDWDGSAISEKLDNAGVMVIFEDPF